MKPIRTALATLIGLALAGSVLAQDVKARLGTSLPDSHPQTLGARKFAELADQKSRGRIKITVYSAAQLGSDVQMQGALRGGTQEFAVPSDAHRSRSFADIASGSTILSARFRASKLPVSQSARASS